MRRRFVFTLAACLFAGTMVQGGPEEKSDAEPLTVIDSEYVCMVTDAAYDRPQVRVDISEKAYYGCCEMCKARLERNEALRTAIDPVSGNEVDKATALIAADSYKRVFYFESRETLDKANKKLSRKE